MAGQWEPCQRRCTRMHTHLQTVGHARTHARTQVCARTHTNTLTHANSYTQTRKYTHTYTCIDRKPSHGIPLDRIARGVYIVPASRISAACMHSGETSQGRREIESAQGGREIESAQEGREIESAAKEACLYKAKKPRQI